MAQQFALIDDSRPRHVPYADAFVIFAVTVLSLAFGAWLLMRLEVGLWAGTMSALGAYAGLLSVHLAVRRSLAGDRDGAGPRGPAGGKLWVAGDASPSLPEAGTAHARSSLAFSPEEEAARWAEAARSDAALLAGELPETGASGPFGYRPRAEPSLPQPQAAPEAAGPAPLAAQPAGEPELPQPGGISQAELSVEVVQDLIKKLADELNSPASAGGAGAEPGNETEAMIARSVAALQAVTRTLQAAPEPAAPVPPAAGGSGIASWWPAVERVSGAEPPAPAAAVPPAIDPQIARIAEAVAAERVEVLLEPIHALVEGRPRHFEVSLRLLTADGARLEQSDFSRTARGSGLMPRIDAARMIRAARVARRLGERGRQGSVLASMASESLADAGFLDAAGAQAWSTGGMGLVLAFAQSEVRAFTEGHAHALGALRAAGLRFALEEVTDLDMDFAALKQMGFEFVELDAPVFLDGLPHGRDRVPASDLCRYLSDFGLALIVGRIEDDWLLARILGFGVLYGKGTLLGSPRPVKDEVVSGAAA